MNVSPISDFLIVELHAEGANSAGIILPFDNAQGPRYGVVIAQGPGYLVPGTGELAAMPCNVGDTVLLQIGAGTEVHIDQKAYQIVPARDLFGVVQAKS